MQEKKEDGQVRGERKSVRVRVRHFPTPLEFLLLCCLRSEGLRRSQGQEELEEGGEEEEKKKRSGLSRRGVQVSGGGEGGGSDFR